MWHGEQLLHEWRTAAGTATGLNSGYAGYVHVEGLDHPVGLIRSDGTRNQLHVARARRVERVRERGSGRRLDCQQQRGRN